MTWFMFSLISIGALASAELLQQYVLNKNKVNEKTSGMLTFGIQALFTLPIILSGKYAKHMFDIFEMTTLPYLIASTVLATYGLIFYLKSFNVKNISISSIFVSSSVVVSTILGILMFGESTYLWKYIGIGMVFISIISLNINNLSLEKNHLYGILAGIFFGSTYTFDKLVVSDIPPLVYLFWSFTLVSLLLLIFNYKEITKGLKKMKTKHLQPIVVSGIGYFVYNLCTFTAYTVGGEVGRVDAINNSQIFLIILFEYFILKQKGDVFRKIATAIIAFTGVLILGYL